MKTAGFVKWRLVKESCFVFVLSVTLSACQIQKPPKALPVFEFRQTSATVVNPASYYACGKRAINTQKETKHVVHQTTV